MDFQISAIGHGYPRIPMDHPMIGFSTQVFVGASMRSGRDNVTTMMICLGDEKAKRGIVQQCSNTSAQAHQARITRNIKQRDKYDP